MSKYSSKIFGAKMLHVVTAPKAERWIFWRESTGKGIPTCKHPHKSLKWRKLSVNLKNFHTDRNSIHMHTCVEHKWSIYLPICSKIFNKPRTDLLVAASRFTIWRRKGMTSRGDSRNRRGAAHFVFSLAERWETNEVFI